MAPLPTPIASAHGAHRARPKRLPLATGTPQSGRGEHISAPPLGWMWRGVPREKGWGANYKSNMNPTSRLHHLLCLLFFGWVLCWRGELAGAVPELENILAKMEKAEKAIQSLSFDFIQTTTIHVTGEQQEVRGSAVFHRPDKFRLEYASPHLQVAVSDGKRFWLHSPDQNQVFVDDWSHWSQRAGFSKGFLTFTQNVGDLRKEFTIKIQERAVEGPNRGWGLELKPREAGPWSTVFRIWVDTTTGIPFKTQMETQSMETVVELTKTRINPILSDRLFVFRVPKGARVVGTLPRATPKIEKSSEGKRKKDFKK